MLKLREISRRSGSGPVTQARSSRAKTKHGKDAGSRNGSAIAATEDAARRWFAAARTESGSTERTQTAAKGKSADQNVQLGSSCGKARPKHKQARLARAKSVIRKDAGR